MKNKPEVVHFHADKKKTTKKLEELKELLDSCVDSGMMDPEASFHNELLDLRDEAELSKTPPELVRSSQRLKFWKRVWMPGSLSEGERASLSIGLKNFSAENQQFA